MRKTGKKLLGTQANWNVLMTIVIADDTKAAFEVIIWRIGRVSTNSNVLSSVKSSCFLPFCNLGIVSCPIFKTLKEKFTSQAFIKSQFDYLLCVYLKSFSRTETIVHLCVLGPKYSTYRCLVNVWWMDEHRIEWHSGPKGLNEQRFRDMKGKSMLSWRPEGQWLELRLVWTDVLGDDQQW